MPEEVDKNEGAEYLVDRNEYTGTLGLEGIQHPKK